MQVGKLHQLRAFQCQRQSNDRQRLRHDFQMMQRELPREHRTGRHSTHCCTCNTSALQELPSIHQDVAGTGACLDVIVRRSSLTIMTVCLRPNQNDTVSHATDIAAAINEIVEIKTPESAMMA